MSEFPKLSLRKYPKTQEHESNEAKYWRSFSLTKHEKLLGSPNCISFNPNDSRQYIVTYSTMISLFDTLNDGIVRSYTRFNDDAFSGRFRRDGKLILAGDKEGLVKVFDVQTKSLLRQMKRHSAAVRSTCWTGDGLHFISGADDGRVKYWDLAMQEVVWESKIPHSDYVRSVEAHPTAVNMFVSASYDHLIRVWDNRVSGHVQEMNHGQPLSACIMNPGGTFLFSAGGNEVKVWDILSGGKLVHTFCNHQKNISCLAMDSNGARLMSGGLDSHLKIYNLQTMKVSHGIRFEGPIMTAGISPSNNKLVVGLVDGTILAHTRIIKSAATTSVKSKIHNNTRLSGNNGGTLIVGKVDAQKYTRLAPYEKLLKSFEYQKALDAALKSNNAIIITSLLEELCHRSGLTIALSGRDELTLQPLLSYATKYIQNPKFGLTISQIISKVLDIYGSDIGLSDALTESFRKLLEQVKAEVAFQRQIMRILGSLDGIVNASAVTKLPRDRSTSIVDL